MKAIEKKATFFAILAALLYALNAPFSKLLMEKIPSTMMAGFLYLGAGVGVSIVWVIKKATTHDEKEKPLTKKELPFTIGMIVLDIIAPIFLMIGLTKTTSANASLLNNFEIVATSIIAFVIFREKITKKLWFAIGLVTISSMILTVEDASSFSFSIGSLFVLAACICWGLENNCTRMLSSKNPMQIVMLKGFFSGLGSFVIALLLGERCGNVIYIILAFILGFLAYGLSIYLYIYAQRWLGAAKTSAFYAVAPFMSVIISWIVYQEVPSLSFLIALVIMIIGTCLVNQS